MAAGGDPVSEIRLIADPDANAVDNFSPSIEIMRIFAIRCQTMAPADIFAPDNAIMPHVGLI